MVLGGDIINKTMRKQVLIFGHSYGPQFVDINNQYTKLFDKAKYEVTVIYLTGEFDENIKARHHADHVIFLNTQKNILRGLKISVIKRILHLCKQKQFQIVICHRYKPSYVMLWVAQFCKIPILFFVMHELNTLKNISRKILIALLARNNMVFAGVSNAVRDDMRKAIWRISHDHVITLHNMIDVEWTQSQFIDRETAREKLNLHNHFMQNHSNENNSENRMNRTFVFGNIGRLVKNKDQTTLILAFAAIKPHCPHAKLMIVGSGQLEQSLKSLVKEFNLEQDIIFTGFLTDGFRYMKAFDTYISSSTQEAFGRVLLEAMIAKIPIIATKVHGVPEVIAETAPLIPAGNPELLAKEMIKAYNSSPQSLNEWGLRGHTRATHYFSLQKFHEIFWGLPWVQAL